MWYGKQHVLNRAQDTVASRPLEKASSSDSRTGDSNRSGDDDVVVELREKECPGEGQRERLGFYPSVSLLPKWKKLWYEP